MRYELLCRNPYNSKYIATDKLLVEIINYHPHDEIYQVGIQFLAEVQHSYLHHDAKRPIFQVLYFVMVKGLGAKKNNK